MTPLPGTYGNTVWTVSGAELNSGKGSPFLLSSTSRHSVFPDMTGSLFPASTPDSGLGKALESSKNGLCRNKDVDIENGLEDTGRGKGKLGGSERV